MQYWDWITGLFSGDMGESARPGRSVPWILGEALVNSAKLAVLAFVMVVPLAVFGGVYAALREGPDATG